MVNYTDYYDDTNTYLAIWADTLMVQNDIYEIKERFSIHCRRLCKTTEIFVAIENIFFYLIFTLTHLVFGFLIFVYIYIYIYIQKYHKIKIQF